MPDTDLLTLPLLEASQAQKHVSHNEALSRLDALVQMAVISQGATTPPATPLDGDRYLLGAVPTGEWAGKAGQIAYRTGGAWRFAAPKTGWRCWVAADNALLLFNGVNWIVPPGAAPQSVALFGVNATADATNRLTVSSSDVLFNNAGADIRVKLNKNALANTASFLFQSGWGGRAEFGLTGDDNFHLKVSPDGATWVEALVIDRVSGKASLVDASIANSTLNPVPAATFKARAAATAGPPQDITALQAVVLLSLQSRMLTRNLALP